MLPPSTMALHLRVKNTNWLRSRRAVLPCHLEAYQLLFLDGVSPWTAPAPTHRPLTSS